MTETAYNFRIEEPALDDILALKEVDFEVQRPGEFEINIINADEWNHEILGAFIDVFHYFEENGIFWDKLILYCSEGNRTYTRPFIRTANSLSLFAELYIGLDEPEHGEILRREETDESDFLCAGITLNDRLERIYFCTENAVVSLGDSRALSRYLQTTTNLKELRLYGFIDFNQELICEGLSGNDTLQQLGFNLHDKDHIQDGTISNIITSLTTHSTLGILTIVTWNQFGDSSSRAIKSLLKNSSTLHNLGLYNASEDDNGNNKLNLENIVQGLKHNRSIKELSFKKSLYGDLIFSRIFNALHTNHSLEFLSLHVEKNYGAKQDLEQLMQMDRLSKPIKLKLGGSVGHFIWNNVQNMEHVLRSHPEIRLKLRDRYRHNSEISKLEFLVDLNWHGRYLLDRQNFPLSLWPLIFEKVNTSRHDTFKSSVVYEFLKGPAFAARFLVE